MLFVGCYSIFPVASATERWETGEKKLWGEKSKEMEGGEEKDGKWERREGRGRKKERKGGRRKWEREMGREREGVVWREEKMEG